ncbi:uncharacterized protein LOC106166565 [Lingula anatina]|uniref:Uncharacterized protein LOC106166565 n=1 Tax=Lingula anatina TaxID=7574 RepID=A0A1S3IQZ9_LINAN|nr:uncharacterized protein LOC106166565 [Lingula anatina]|eukprot:XP_013400632.1 uncharacterized protein LOC106166565 [Lingula anatina]
MAELNATLANSTALLNIAPEYKYYLWIMNAIIFLCAVVGVTLNTLALAVFYKSIEYNKTSYLLFCLAINDNIFLVLRTVQLIIISVYLYYAEVRSTTLLTSISGLQVTLYFLMTLQTYIAALVSQERYCSVKKLYNVQSKVPLTRREKLFPLSVVIAGLLLFNVLKALDVDHLKIDKCTDAAFCPTLFLKQGPNWKIYSIVFRIVSEILLSVLLPVGMFMYYTVKTFKKLFFQYPMLPTNMYNAAKIAQRKKLHREMMKIVIVIAAFMMINTLLNFSMQIKFVFPTVGPSVSPIAILLVAVFTAVNSSLNFFVYGMFGSLFRKEIKSICCCKT